MYTERRYRCPHCFTEFKTGEFSDDVEFTCRQCGNGFTLGEAKRGRPDPGPETREAITALTEQVARLERQLNQFEDHFTRTLDILLAKKSA